MKSEEFLKKVRLSELVEKDKVGFGFLSAYGWTCSRCVLEGYLRMKKAGMELPDEIKEEIEKWLPKLKCECVPEKKLEIDEKGLRMLQEREKEPVADIDFECEDVEKPQLVEYW